MKNKKDFSKWMPVKQDIHDAQKRPFYHEREIWWCSVGLNVGFEVDGKGMSYARPVLIIKDFNRAVFWGVPVTTQLKQGKYYVDIDLRDGISRQVVLSQIRFMDGKRLSKKIGMLDMETFLKIKRAISAFLVDSPFSDLPPAEAFADAGSEAEAIILLPPPESGSEPETPKIDL